MIKEAAIFYFIAFVLNLAWEFNYSCLYKTFQRIEPTVKNILLVFNSLKSGLILTAFYLLSDALTGNALTGMGGATVFGMALVFSFVDESFSTSSKKWEYSERMPTVFGVGVYPLIRMAVTGVFTIFLIQLL